jgi:hypothetical protein
MADKIPGGLFHRFGGEFIIVHLAGVLPMHAENVPRSSLAD